MLNFLISDPFGSGITQRALAETVLLGLVCGPLGVWVLAYRQAFAAESLAHALLPGLVLGAIIGVPLAVGAGGGIVLAAVLIFWVGRDERLGGQTAVAVVVTSALGVGALLALTPDVPPRLEDLLFGDPLGVDGTDLAIAAGVVSSLMVALLVAHRGLALAAFDPAAARALGAPRRAELVVLLLLGAAIVASASALGNLLALALLLGPALTASRLSGRLSAQLPLAAAFAALSAYAGLLLSHHLELAAGATIALVAALPALVPLLLPGGPTRRGSVIEAVGGR